MRYRYGDLAWCGQYGRASLVLVLEAAAEGWLTRAGDPMPAALRARPRHRSPARRLVRGGAVKRDTVAWSIVPDM